MTPKQLKQLDPKVTKVFSESEVGAMLEHIDDKLGVIVEGQKTLDNRVDRIENRMERVENKVDVLTDTVGEMKVELTAINRKLDQKADRIVVQKLDQRVIALEAK